MEIVTLKRYCSGDSDLKRYCSGDSDLKRYCSGEVSHHFLVATSLQALQHRLS